METLTTKLEGKKILITGGTGSFGKTMVRHLINKKCREIRVFSRDEEKQDSMRITINAENIKYYIGDVRDRLSVDNAMRGVDLVFHAAALKQVPSCEFFPMQAVQTNVIGSNNVIQSAILHKVNSVVCLSTDKAVFPINAMGMTKGLMEKVVQAASRSLDTNNPILSCIRYGNVMYSRGSVIPLFIRQITEEQPLTITEPSMTRFMLPLSGAVDLVEFALNNAQQGDIFIKKAPACTIRELAEAMCELFSTNANTTVIGVRHGEKLYETLASSEELLRSEDLGDYYRVAMDIRDLNYSKFFTEGDTEEASTADYNSHNTYRLNRVEIKELLLSLPEVRSELEKWNNSKPLS